MAYTPEERRAYDKQWSKANRAKRQALNNRWRHKRAAWLREFKAQQKCNRCGENHPATLQFHHVDGKRKESAVGTAAPKWSEERILKEIAKCEILCANCHAREHYKS